MDETREVWRGLAGPLYEDIMQSKGTALANLSHMDKNVRIAAISICCRHWDCSRDADFLNACRTIAATDPDGSVRGEAIDAIGEALEGSQDASVSRFLADLAADADAADDVRRRAYLALRAIQVGLTEQEIARRAAVLMKLALRKLPLGITEEEAKKAALCGGRFPEGVWDSAEEIDWNFVGRFASPK